MRALLRATAYEVEGSLSYTILLLIPVIKIWFFSRLDINISVRKELIQLQLALLRRLRRIVLARCAAGARALRELDIGAFDVEGAAHLLVPFVGVVFGEKCGGVALRLVIYGYFVWGLAVLVYNTHCRFFASRILVAAGGRCSRHYYWG